MRSKLSLGFCVLAMLVVSTSSRGQGTERVVKARGVLSVDAVKPGTRFKLAVILNVADGYHINSHVPTLPDLIATEVELQAPQGITIGPSAYPAASRRKFQFSPDTALSVYEGDVIITAEADAASGAESGLISGSVHVQACNDVACLQDSRIAVDIPVKIAGAKQAVAEINGDVFAKAASAAGEGQTLIEFTGAPVRADSIAERIQAKGLLLTLLFVFAMGLALNATPCVYPIIPITIGFFTMQGQSAEGASKVRKMLGMASAYTLGIAITYSLLGVVAAMTGGLFGAALQKPFVLIGLAGVMVALSLSMFGVYEFRLPQFLNRFASNTTQSVSGVIGALVMGLTMGIVAAPCIGPFVVALLVHVGAKGDPLYGFVMFFVLALGLGAPFLVLGTFSSALSRLPRSGEWMVTVRKVMGLVLLAMALYFLMPLMGRATTAAFMVFFAVSAIYLVLWESRHVMLKGFVWVLRAIGGGAAVVAVWLAVSAVSGGATGEPLNWETYSEARLAAARNEGKLVMIDASADWCLSCKELDKLTFSDSSVRKAASSFVTLKLDLTSAEKGTEPGAAKEKFAVLGLPTIMFLDARGRELGGLRLEGFEKPEQFVERLHKATSASQTGEPAANATGNQNPAADRKPTADVTLTMLNGPSLDLKTARGKVVVLDYWATWCLPCKSEIPTFNALNEQYSHRGVEIIGISTDEEGASVVRPFVKANGMKYKIAIGNLDLAGRFGVTDALPVTILIDKQGMTRFTHVGVTEQATFEAEIRQLIAE
ncbi:MAG TPA: cytochrome c biogenesis protein CcdA [Blastocatellia bacterium]|nr:cytochrome c biogenesis protein CcdA [Blastocatellia bacterium]